MGAPKGLARGADVPREGGYLVSPSAGARAWGRDVPRLRPARAEVVETSTSILARRASRVAAAQAPELVLKRELSGDISTLRSRCNFKSLSFCSFRRQMVIEQGRVVSWWSSLRGFGLLVAITGLRSNGLRFVAREAGRYGESSSTLELDHESRFFAARGSC